jgi:hypothetical protein
LIPATVEAILAQRLVRKVCLQCRPGWKKSPKKQPSGSRSKHTPDRFLGNLERLGQLGWVFAAGLRHVRAATPTPADLRRHRPNPLAGAEFPGL